MSDMFEAGKFAALTKNLALSRTSELAGAILGKLSTTSNRLLLAPPPINLPVSYTHLRAHETR